MCALYAGHSGFFVSYLFMKEGLNQRQGQVKHQRQHIPRLRGGYPASQVSRSSSENEVAASPEWRT